jgi:hypothetical protein
MGAQWECNTMSSRLSLFSKVRSFLQVEVFCWDFWGAESSKGVFGSDFKGLYEKFKYCRSEPGQSGLSYLLVTRTEIECGNGCCGSE